MKIDIWSKLGLFEGQPNPNGAGDGTSTPGTGSPSNTPGAAGSPRYADPAVVATLLKGAGYDGIAHKAGEREVVVRNDENFSVNLGRSLGTADTYQRSAQTLHQLGIEIGSQTLAEDLAALTTKQRDSAIEELFTRAANNDPQALAAIQKFGADIHDPNKPPTPPEEEWDGEKRLSAMLTERYKDRFLEDKDDEGNVKGKRPLSEATMEFLKQPGAANALWEFMRGELADLRKSMKGSGQFDPNAVKDLARQTFNEINLTGQVNRLAKSLRERHPEWTNVQLGQSIRDAQNRWDPSTGIEFEQFAKDHFLTLPRQYVQTEADIPQDVLAAHDAKMRAEWLKELQSPHAPSETRRASGGAGGASKPISEMTFEEKEAEYARLRGIR